MALLYHHACLMTLLHAIVLCYTLCRFCLLYCTQYITCVIEHLLTHIFLSRNNKSILYKYNVLDFSDLLNHMTRPRPRTWFIYTIPRKSKILFWELEPWVCTASVSDRKASQFIIKHYWIYDGRLILWSSCSYILHITIRSSTNICPRHPIRNSIA